MRLYLIILLISLATPPALANDTLELEFIKSCQNNFNKSKHFCECSYNELGRTPPVYTSQPYQFHLESFQKRTKLLLSTSNITTDIINTICTKHDVSHKHTEQHYKKIKIDRLPISTEEQQKYMRKDRKIKQDINTFWGAFKTPYNTKFMHTYCSDKRWHKEVKEDYQKISNAKNNERPIPQAMLRQLAQGPKGHRHIIRSTSRKDCPQ